MQPPCSKKRANTGSFSSRATGNLTLLVVVDSSKPADYIIFQNLVAKALNHFGIPYCICDLAKNPSALDEASEHPAILLGQEQIARRLSSHQLARAVAKGCGIVSLDSQVKGCPRDFLGLMGIDTVRDPYPTFGLTTSDIQHFITGTRVPRQILRTKTILWPYEVKPTPSAKKLIEVPFIECFGPFVGRPLLLANDSAGSRCVQFLFPPHIWDNEYLGFLQGLDDLLWKSIVWAARKPLVMKAMPPFVGVRLDDCKGGYDHFGYLDIFNRHGYIPEVGFYLDEVGKEEIKVMRQRSQANLAEFFPHAFGNNVDQLIYGKLAPDSYELSTSQLQRSFSRIDTTCKRWGLKLGKTVNPHWHFVGRNAVPFLRKRGQAYVMATMIPGKPQTGENYRKLNEGWQPLPYGDYGFITDYLPGTNDMFIASAHTLSQLGFDFTLGLTVNKDENRINDVEALSAAGAKQVSLGLDSLFFGVLTAHEQRLSALSPQEFDLVLSRIDEKMSSRERIFKNYDYIAEYAKSKFDSRISQVSIHGKKIHLQMEGSASLKQQLYLYLPAGDDTVHTYSELPAFKGKIEVEIGI